MDARARPRAASGLEASDVEAVKLEAKVAERAAVGLEAVEVEKLRLASDSGVKGRRGAVRLTLSSRGWQ